MDRLAWAHRWLGFATVWLIGGHIVLTIDRLRAGRRAVASSPSSATLVLDVPVRPLGSRRVPPVRDARASRRSGPSRRRLSYETWYFLHLYALPRDRPRLPPPAVRRRGLHPRPAGRDLLDLAVRADGVAGPRLPRRPAARHLDCATGSGSRRSCPRRPASRRSTSPAATSTGCPSGPASTSSSGSSPATAGGAATRTRCPRRPTAAGSGSPSRPSATTAPACSGSRSGTAVFVEGPYGILTGARRSAPQGDADRGRHRHRPAARPPGIAGRATRRAHAALPRRAQETDIVFRDELDLLAAHRGAVVHYLLGRRTDDPSTSPVGRATIARLVPDIAEQDVYVCGPTDMMRAVEESLARARRARRARSTRSGSRTDPRGATSQARSQRPLPTSRRTLTESRARRTRQCRSVARSPSG